MSQSSQEKKGSFFGGAAILAAGIAVVKLLGAFFKIPIGNILGDEGFGHFNNAYVIYNLLLMISTAGLPLALSKTIAEADALGRPNQVKRTFNVALASFLVLGLVTMVVMFTFAQPLATLQGDSLAAMGVRALAPACFFVCVISAFRGYAQGHANMVPTSVSQVIEAAVKVVVGIGLAAYFMRLSAGTEVAAAGAIFGVTAGAGVALVFLIADFMRRRSKNRAAVSTDRPEPIPQVLKRLLMIAIPITIGASVTPVTTWLDTTQVQNILRDVMQAQPADWYQSMGQTDPVVSIYGSYQKAVTIFNLPSSFMVAITACIIPAISAALVQGNTRQVGRITESSLRMASLLALPAGVGLTVVATPIIRTLFYGTDYSVAEPCMQILGIASIFVCIMFLCNAILQASGFVNLPIVAMVVGCAAKLLVNNFLVRREEFGIIGAPIGTLVCYAIVALIELYIIKRKIPAAPNYRRTFLKPLFAALIMGAAAWAASGLLTKLLLGITAFQAQVAGVVDLTRMGYAVVTVGTIGVAVVVYLILVVFTHAITREDLSLMPKGDKIAKILRIGD